MAARRKPAVVNLGKTYIPDPPGPGIEEKFRLVARYLDVLVVASGPHRYRVIEGVCVVGVPRIRPAFLGSLVFHLVGPLIAVAAARKRTSTAIVCQSPFEGACVLLLCRLVAKQKRPRVVVEIHGDWRTAPRDYGSRARRILAPAADRVAAWAIRRADRVRAVGEAMEELARQVGYVGTIDRHVAFGRFDEFLGRGDAAPRAPSMTPTALFAGVLQRYKAPDVLLDAWVIVAERVPHARLVMLGDGPMRDALHRRANRLDIDDRVTFAGHVEHDRVVAALDDSWCLVLPSRSEGLPRIAIEAMARSRCVVGAAAGGIPELVVPNSTGVLVPPDDPQALANTLVEVLNNRDRALEMGRCARRGIEAWDPVREYQAGVRRLAQWVGAG